MIDILIPTFGRSHRLSRVAANVHAATTVPHYLVFIVEREDGGSCAEAARLAAAGQCGWMINEGAASYAGAVNTGYRHTSDPYFFLGSDDVYFHPGWAECVLAAAVPPFRVVGTNDTINDSVLAGIHATHYLVERGYIEELGGVVDELPGTVLHEGYDHNYTDTEFIEVATKRGVFTPCLEAVVEHMHFAFGKGPRDATADRTIRRYSEDARIYESRRPLWEHLTP